MGAPADALAGRPGLGDRLSVVLGGAVGTLLRAGLAPLGAASDAGLPWGTLAANLAGALALGLLVGAVESGRAVGRRTVTGLGTGLLGAFTTFSALSVETVILLERSVGAAVGYLAASLAAGIALAWAGRRAGHRAGSAPGGGA